MKEPRGDGADLSEHGRNSKAVPLLSSEGKHMGLTEEDRTWLLAQFAGINGRIDRVETSFNARIERVETSLLTEFHKWASPMEQRMRSHRELLRTLDLETERLDERVAKLEPPRQQ
jgi:hypothetical protein